jgi:hypothetical protein
MGFNFTVSMQIISVLSRMFYMGINMVTAVSWASLHISGIYDAY